MTALVVALMAMTPLGEAASSQLRATFAANAGKLRGFAPSKAAKKNTVVVRGANGKIGAASLPLTRGPRGLSGPAGAAGPAGATGAAGPAGATGPAGTQGIPGPSGTPGSAVAYAHVLANGDVDEARSKNVTDANVALRATSAYCFSGLTFSFNSVVATIDYGDSGLTDKIVQVQLGPGTFDCLAAEVLEVATSDASAGFEPEAFFIVFN